MLNSNTYVLKLPQKHKSPTTLMDFVDFHSSYLANL